MFAVQDVFFTDGSYQLLLVALSLLIAALTGYATLSLLGGPNRTINQGKRWDFLGATAAMGIGAWSAHFTGVLALRFPNVELGFSLLPMGLSLFVIIAASAFSFFLLKIKESSSVSTVISSGLALGVGIVLLHYTAASSLQFAGDLQRDIGLFLLSSVTSLVSATLGLLIVFRPEGYKLPVKFLRVHPRMCGGLLLGLSIASAHYIGTRSLIFLETGVAPPDLGFSILDSLGVGLTIALFTIFALVLGLIGAAVERALTRRKKVADENAELYEAAEEARLRAEKSEEQQEALSKFGQAALSGAAPITLLHQAVDILRAKLNVDYAKILELDVETQHLHLRASTGWDQAEIKDASIKVGPHSQAGYTILSRGPVIVEDLAKEQRFEESSLFEEEFATSGISVIIEGREGPWGTLGAFTREKRVFNRKDVSFVQALANILAQAIDRDVTEKEKNNLLESESMARRNAELRAEEEEALRKAAEAVSAANSIEEVLAQVALSALTATRATGVFVEEYVQIQGQVNVIFSKGDVVDQENKVYEYRDSFIYQLAEDLPIADYKIFESVEEVPQNIHCPLSNCSIMLLPLMADKDSPLGALVLIKNVEEGPFKPYEIRRAKTFGSLGSLALKRNRMFYELEKRHDELARVTESRTRLIRGFSHDVKNPLGAADGFLQLLEQGLAGELSERALQAVGRARSTIHSALTLIKDLVAIAEAENGEVEIKVDPVSPSEFLRDIADDYSPQAEQKQLSLVLKASEDAPTLNTDPARVRQILGNLLSNAIKYTDSGEVVVSGERRRGRAPDKKMWYAIDVTDTGPGIPTAQHELLFREFSRIRLEGSVEKEGVGLGLAISQKLANALGGRITLRSELGEGSTFTLWLPLEKDAIFEERQEVYQTA